MYDFLIRGGRVVDPGLNLDACRDVAVSGGRIAALLDPAGPIGPSLRVVNATGKVIVPGLIDFHVHVFPGVSHFGVDADSTCLARGVTSVLDFGTAGGMIFPGFRRFVIDAAHTRVFALLHIAAQGLIDSLGDPPAYGELHDLRHCDVELVQRTVEQHRDVIPGIKIRCTANLAENGVNEAAALQKARLAADLTGLPLVIHSPNSSLPIEQVLDHLQPGDVLTHCFHGKACGLVDQHLQVQPHIRQRLDSGILLDVGHGFSSFNFRVARSLIEQGVMPDFISSDIHHYNLNGPVFDLVTTMDKFLHLGLSLNEVIRRTTQTPAKFLHREEELGTLRPGAIADITVLEMQEGEFPLIDAEGNQEIGHQHLEPFMTFRAGLQVGVIPRACS